MTIKLPPNIFGKNLSILFSIRVIDIKILFKKGLIEMLLLNSSSEILSFLSRLIKARKNKRGIILIKKYFEIIISNPLLLSN